MPPCHTQSCYTQTSSRHHERSAVPPHSAGSSAWPDATLPRTTGDCIGDAHCRQDAVWPLGGGCSLQFLPMGGLNDARQTWPVCGQPQSQFDLRPDGPAIQAISAAALQASLWTFIWPWPSPSRAHGAPGSSTSDRCMYSAVRCAVYWSREAQGAAHICLSAHWRAFTRNKVSKAERRRDSTEKK